MSTPSASSTPQPPASTPSASSPSSQPPSSTSTPPLPHPHPQPLDPKPSILLITPRTGTPEPDLPAATWARLNALFTIHRYTGAATLPAFLAALAAPPLSTAPLRAIVRTGWLKSGPYASTRFFDAAAVPHLPGTLELVTCSGHGHDAADVAGLRARGVAYANTPDTCTEAVANAALYLVLGSFRYFTFAERCARGGPGDGDEFHWQRSRELGLKAEEPAGRVLGVVGMGDIGVAIARKAAAGLGMRVHYHNRRRSEEGERVLEPLGGAVWHETLEGLLEVADCVCLAAPLTDATRHMLDRRTLALTKASGVRVVNIARGGLIDEEALLEAMESGRVVGVGLDVHANEPGVNPKLRDNWMTTLLPHIGVCSNTTWREFDRVTFQNLEEWFYGDKSKVPVVN
ncbi:putative glyoxylate reductase [Neofusicoccum parvum]|uniref:Glyoxylate reductase n=1 Tax=Neofusicoccum parvum TaxID=310453 RepID=A0ACB5RU93_9PEZI|nr:putative glyoxylate reductase [Neofusicoccum parvum]